MNPDSCNYIVITKKNDKAAFFGKEASIKEKDTNFIQFAEEIKITQAIDMITRYNERYNNMLSNTCAINFEYDEILKYLVIAKITDPNLKYIRFYLGTHKDVEVGRTEMNRRNSVIVSVTDNTGKEYYLGEGKNEVIDYGGLCPPPSNIDGTVNGKEGIHEKGYLLLEAALRQSTDNKLRASVGLPPIKAKKK